MEDLTFYSPLLTLVYFYVTGGSGNRIPFTEISERKQLASVSTALLLAVGIGIFEALALSLGSGPFLNLMGVTSVSFNH